jgi:hypothetical protein
MMEHKLIYLHFDGGFRRRVPALVIGAWAVHAAIQSGVADSYGFSVTHVPTGMSMNALAADVDLWDAIDIVERLSHLFPGLTVDGDGLVHADDRDLLISIVAEVIGESDR